MSHTLTQARYKLTNGSVSQVIRTLPRNRYGQLRIGDAIELSSEAGEACEPEHGRLQSSMSESRQFLSLYNVQKFEILSFEIRSWSEINAKASFAPNIFGIICELLIK